jgi:hypothetical protein
MSVKANGQIRRGQVITTYGPGALIDLPRHSGIVGGLDTWPKPSTLKEIPEPRLAQKLQLLTKVTAPKLYEPPPDTDAPGDTPRGIVAWRFPEWFVVQESVDTQDRRQSRRLVQRPALDSRSKFDGRSVVATRFVRACPKGHVDDLDWRGFVHGPEDNCRRQLWLDERGTSGDLADLYVRCVCGKQRPLYEAAEYDPMPEANPLGRCRGMRPWLGNNSGEDCNLAARLLIRTASNAYFPQVVSVLSLPNQGNAVLTAVKALWGDLQIVDDEAGLNFMKKKPPIVDQLASWTSSHRSATRMCSLRSNSTNPVRPMTAR